MCICMCIYIYIYIHRYIYIYICIYRSLTPFGRMRNTAKLSKKKLLGKKCCLAIMNKRSHSVHGALRKSTLYISDSVWLKLRTSSSFVWSYAVEWRMALPTGGPCRGPGTSPARGVAGFGDRKMAAMHARPPWPRQPDSRTAGQPDSRTAGQPDGRTRQPDVH